jgi:hypothetical protein
MSTALESLLTWIILQPCQIDDIKLLHNDVMYISIVTTTVSPVATVFNWPACYVSDGFRFMDERIYGRCFTRTSIEHMTEQRSRHSCGYLSLVAIGMILISSKSGGAEFAIFKLTNVEGAMSLGYSLTETSQEDTYRDETYEKRPSMEQELSLNTRSYLYHPNLLEMELDGGVRFRQETLESRTQKNDTNGTYFDFRGRWRFLKSKAYPVSLYYSQSNPTKAVGFADSLAIETQNYGMEFSLRQPLITTPVTIRLDHNQNKGESSSRIVDDATDTVSLKMMLNIGDNGSGQWGVTSISQKSASGSRLLALQASESNVDTFDWNGKLIFGDKRNITLSNYLLASRNEQNNTSDRDQINFYNHLAWDIDDSLRAYNTYNYLKTSYEMNDSKNQQLLLGATKDISDTWSISSTIETTDEVSTGLDLSTWGLSGGLNYRGDLTDHWSSSAGYTALVRYNYQDATQANIGVIDESLVLSGLSAVSLLHEYIPIDSISVSNITHTQIYLENIDYQLTVIGSETRVERLSSGNISDGETVLVNYEYESGGSFDYKEVKHGLSFMVSLDKRYNFSMFYSTVKQDLLEGIPTRILEDDERYRVGMDAQLPISQIADYGWQLEYERRKNDLYPFTRTSADLNFNTKLPFFASVANLSSGYEHIDNELSPIDIEETYYTLGLSSRLSWRSLTSLEMTYKRDTGSELFKSTTYTSLRYFWSRGRLSFSLSARQSKEKQGSTSRSHASINASLVRYFR